jgi:hypothetical protein
VSDGGAVHGRNLSTLTGIAVGTNPNGARHWPDKSSDLDPGAPGKELQMSRITPFVLVLLCWSVANPAAADPLLASIDILLQEPTELVREWEVARYISIAIVTVVVFLGAAVAVVHSLPMTISKVGAVALGSAVTLLTGLNNAYFDFDHRQYKAMATQGRLLLAEIKVKINELSQFPLDQQDARKAIFEQIRRHKNEILALPMAFQERGVRTAGDVRPAGFIAPAYAQAGRPEWITKVPVDDEHLYFLGDAQGSDYFGTVRASPRKHPTACARRPTRGSWT